MKNVSNFHYRIIQRKEEDYIKKLYVMFAERMVVGILSSSLTFAQNQGNPQPEDQQLGRSITMLRTDLAAQKAAVIVSSLHLTEAETEALLQSTKIEGNHSCSYFTFCRFF